MNTKPKTARNAAHRPSSQLATTNGQSELIQQNFDALGDPTNIVEHLTVPGFLKLIDHRWNLHDIRRFGDTVGNMAEALHVSYIPAADRALGILRMFPEPLLRRVYDTLAAQCGWPQIIDVDTPQLEESKRKRDAIKNHERTLKQMASLIAETDDVSELESLNASVKLIEAKLAALRAGLGEPLATA